MSWRLWLALLLGLLTATAIAEDFAAARTRLQTLGLQVEQIQAEGGVVGWTHLAVLLGSDRAGQEDRRYLQYLSCQRPDDALQQIDDWARRLQSSAPQLVAADDSVEARAWLSAVGLVPAMVLMQVHVFATACPREAIRLLDKAATRAASGHYPGDPGLVAARYRLARQGLLAHAGAADASVPQLLHALQQVNDAATAAGVALASMDRLARYADRLQQMTRTPLAPVWRVDPVRTAARVAGPFRVRLSEWSGWRLSALLEPALPHETLVLARTGSAPAAAAYALADLFEVDLFEVDQPHGSGIGYDPAALVFAVWGAQQTRLALERAVAQIEIVPRGGELLAVLHLLGHSFVLESGERGCDERVRWYSADEVASRFRQSRAYRMLAGEVEAD